MKPIKVKWDYVETAFERNSPDLQSYIDRDTGDVLVVVEGVPDDDEARRRVSENPERYVKIEPASSREQYRWMERFVASVQEESLRERLLLAIDGKGAFRRFKDVLMSYPVERERWFNYRAKLLHYHINEWFAAKGYTPDPQPPWGEVEPPVEAAEPLEKPVDGGPADTLRKQLKALVDLLPACELHSAKVFFEFLKERGSSALLPGRMTDVPATPVQPVEEVDAEEQSRAPDSALKMV
jgi:hypothetical protein